MADEKMTSRRLAGRNRVCSLEVISEEGELDPINENSTPTESRGNGMRKHFSTSFKPFRSSWNTCSTKTTEHSKSSSINTTANLRQQFDSLKTEYEELLEINRLQVLEKKFAVSRVIELEKKYLQLKYLSDQNIDNLHSERKRAEQLKTDYEFLLDAQKKSFKRREKELLEEIDDYASKINGDIDISIGSETDISTISTFEYEEITEKLNSLEKQNDLLQRNRDTMVSQNEILSNTLAELKKSYTYLVLKYNFLKKNRPKWLNIQLGINKYTDSNNFSKIQDDFKKPIMITEETQTEINVDLEEGENILTVAEKPTELLKTEEKLDYVNFNKSSYSEKSSDCSQKIETKNESYASFLNILEICLANIDVNLLNKSMNISNKLCCHTNSTILENNKDFEEFYTMNLSDSEKINKGNLFIEEKITATDIQLRDPMENFKSFSDNNKADINCQMNDNMIITSLVEKHENLIAEFETLKKQNYLQKLEYEKISRLVQEKDEVINYIQKEITETKKENENWKACIEDLTTLIDDQRLKLNKLVEISHNNNNNFRNSTHDRKSESEKKNLSESIHIEVPKLENETSGMDMIHKIQMTNKIEIFDQNVVQLETRLIYLQNDNKNLRESISKIKKDAQEIRREYVKCANKIEEQFKNFEADIRETRKVYERTFELMTEEIKTRNFLIQKLQREVKMCNEKNEKPNTKKKDDDTIKTIELKRDIEKTSKNSNMSEINENNLGNTRQKAKNDQEQTLEYREESPLKTKIVKNLEEQKDLQKILTKTEESINSIEKEHFRFNARINRIEVVGFEKSKFEKKIENYKGQKYSKQKNVDFEIIGDFKRENRWKLSRTQEYDSRRNIDLNSIHTGE